VVGCQSVKVEGKSHNWGLAIIYPDEARRFMKSRSRRGRHKERGEKQTARGRMVR